MTVSFRRPDSAFSFLLSFFVSVFVVVVVQ